MQGDVLLAEFTNHEEQQPSLSQECQQNTKRVTEIRDIDVSYFEFRLRLAICNRYQLDKLFQELSHYVEKLGIAYPRIELTSKLRNEDLVIHMEEIISLLRGVVSSYMEGKQMEIPNNNKDKLMEQVQSHSKEFVEQVCNFEKEMFNIHPKHCKICHQRRLNLQMAKKDICSRCNREKSEEHKFSHGNSALPTWIDSDGNVRYSIPMELSELTLAEKLLIQKVSPLIPVIHIKNGTLGSRGHVVSFFQDISGICNELPRLPNNVTMVKVVRQSLSNDGEAIRKAFMVNRLKVLKALQWLKKYNVLYKDIDIVESNLDWISDSNESQLQNIIHVDSKETEVEDDDRYVPYIFFLFMDFFDFTQKIHSAHDVLPSFIK